MTSRNETQDRLVLEFVQQFHAEHGYAPSIRDVCEALDVSAISTGHHRVLRLIREGTLRHSPGVARSLALTPKGMVLIGGTAEL